MADLAGIEARKARRHPAPVGSGPVRPSAGEVASRKADHLVHAGRQATGLAVDVAGGIALAGSGHRPEDVPARRRRPGRGGRSPQVDGGRGAVGDEHLGHGGKVTSVAGDDKQKFGEPALNRRRPTQDTSTDPTQAAPARSGDGARDERDRLWAAASLAGAGCVASDEEADELLTAAGGDRELLERLVRRRIVGEPTAWIVGQVLFCGVAVKVQPGLYVPRWQSEALAERAAALLAEDGTALDICTGSGAIAAVLRARRPAARVVATDLDPAAVACARANGVETYLGDLTAPVPPELAGGVDVLAAVVPYVPTEALRLLPRDVQAFEPRRALDGGPLGTEVLARLAAEATRWLRPGGALVLELGGEQGVELERRLGELGYDEIALRRDDEGELRGIEAVRPHVAD